MAAWSMELIKESPLDIDKSDGLLHVVDQSNGDLLC